MFDRRLLGDGEELILDLRPHWTGLSRPVAVLGVVILAGVVSIAIDTPRLVKYAVAAALVTCLVWLVGRYLRWRNINFVLTSDRLIYRTGVAAKRGLEIPLDRIGTIRFEQRFFERLLQRGDLFIEALGDGGVQVFHNVPRPQHVQREIYSAIETDQRALHHPTPAQSSPNHSPGHRPAPGSEPAASQPGGSPYSIPQQIDQLDQLRRRGVITEFEFEEKKRELLNRM